MTLVKVGLLTIGQSPREDVVPEMKPFFLPQIQILEKGLLDNLSPEEIGRLKPKAGETQLVTRLRKGSPVQLSEKKISSLLPEAIDSMKTKMKVKALGILCTHDFQKTEFPSSVIFPFNALKFLITHIINVKCLGVVVPLEGQIDTAKKKWKKDKVVVEAKSPYARGKSWKEIAQNFSRKKVEVVILDCIGYKIKDKRALQKLLSIPVLLPRVVLAFAIDQHV
jgi:protein AroM